MSTHADIVSLGKKEPRGLDVDALKGDLAALWREAGDETEESAVSRACHGTLVIPARPDEPVEDRVLEVIQRHPARVIVVRDDPDRDSGDVEAWVTAGCSRRPGGSLVCSEGIHISAGPGTERHVASAVRSLAIGGLPVIILSESMSPLEVSWVPRLENVSDLVIGDTEGMDEASGLEFWERIVAGNPGTDYRDLQWARLIDWRRAMASWFDRPEERALLGSIRRAAVTCGSSPGARLKGWLLLGWLGSRLGWGADGEVSMELVEGDGNPEAPLIQSVDLDFGADRARLRWLRLATEEAIAVQEEDGRPLFRLNQSKTHRSGAVVSMIQRYGPGVVAREAMSLAHSLVMRDGT